MPTENDRQQRALQADLSLDRPGPKPTLTLVASLFGFALIMLDASVVNVAPVLLVPLALGAGLALPPLTAAMMETVPPNGPGSPRACSTRPARSPAGSAWRRSAPWSQAASRTACGRAW